MIREAIRDRMTYKGITQTELCRDNGLTIQNFSSFLKGKRGLPPKKFEKVINYLGLYLQYNGKGYEIALFPYLAKKAIKDKYHRVAKFADTMGLSPSTVSTVLSGKRQPSFKTLEMFFDTLGFNLVHQNAYKREEQPADGNQDENN